VIGYEKKGTTFDHPLTYGLDFLFGECGWRWERPIAVLIPFGHRIRDN
jgi:hypothetical protein